jgi:hypothetical protein
VCGGEQQGVCVGGGGGAWKPQFRVRVDMARACKMRHLLQLPATHICVCARARGFVRAGLWVKSMGPVCRARQLRVGDHCKA